MLITIRFLKKLLSTVFILALFIMQGVPVSPAMNLPSNEQQYSTTQKMPASSVAPSQSGQLAQPPGTLVPPLTIYVPPAQVNPVTMVISQSVIRDTSAQIAVTVDQTGGIPTVMLFQYQNTASGAENTITKKIPSDGTMTFLAKNLKPNTAYEVEIVAMQHDEQAAILKDKFQTKEADADINVLAAGGKQKGEEYYSDKEI